MVEAKTVIARGPKNAMLRDYSQAMKARREAAGAGPNMMKRQQQ
jgi:hypothetical protein